MKTTFKSMMVIGMMILGTMTTFGKTNTNVNNGRTHFGVTTTTANRECNLRHVHDRYCGGKTTVIVKNECNLRHVHDRYCGGRTTVVRNYPVMDSNVRNHIIKGNHNFDRHDVCKKCKLTRTEIRRIERDMTDRNSGPCPRR